MTVYVLYKGDSAIPAWEPEKPPVSAFEIIDRVAEFDQLVNRKPFHRDFVRVFGELATTWPTRKECTGITIHHTLSHSPTATAGYITRSKGYPTTQYSYWVSAGDGCPVYQCLRDSVACWHDHTGRLQTTISVGMAGRWDREKPALEQIEATVNLCWELMKRYGFPSRNVLGHRERALAANVSTVCPGWYAAKWLDEFFTALDAVVNAGG